MKKIIYIFLALVLLVSSCSTNQKQTNVIDPSNAIETVSDVTKLAGYLNLYIRSLSTGSSVYYTEIAADLLDPGLNYGNRGGAWWRWEWTSETEIGIFPTCYSGIAQAMFVIEGAEALDKTDLTDAELAELNDALALCYFTKAYLGWKLLQYYCDLYTSTYIDPSAEGTGIMVIDKYNPSGDISTYPGRSSLVDSYAWVLDNLATAKGMLKTTSAVGSPAPTKDACDALHARIALYMGNNTEAASLASSLVDGGKYPLAEGDAETKALWVNDSGKECIMMNYCDYPNSLPGSYSYSYINYQSSTKLYTPDYMPQKWVVNLYSATDLRKTNWFQSQKVTYGTVSGTVQLFAKFQGNPALQAATATSSSYLQKPKPFRIAEQYLIAAEAYALNKAESTAKTYLKNLQSKRDESYDPAYVDGLSGDALLEEIRKERTRELIGEGFRFFDLKRYGQGMTRQGCQSETLANLSAGSS